jgi:hypothetical protein
MPREQESKVKAEKRVRFIVVKFCKDEMCGSKMTIKIAHFIDKRLSKFALIVCKRSKLPFEKSFGSFQNRTQIGRGFVFECVGVEKRTLASNPLFKSSEASRVGLPRQGSKGNPFAEDECGRGKRLE